MTGLKDGKMKAAVAYGPRNIRIELVDVPAISDYEVLIRVKVIGICPSDVRSYEGVYKREMYPYGLESYGLSGHEWCGEIVEVGGSVEEFSVGDRVVPEIIIPCGTCKFCRKGMSNICANKRNITRGYAEYAKAPAAFLFKIPPNVSFEAAAFTEPIAVCLHTNEIISPKPGDSILIIGGGPMGLIHTQVSKMSGATVILSEVIEERLRAAEKFGADFVVNPMEEDLTGRVRELTDGYGADAVIVATGNKNAIEAGVKTVSNAGTVVLFGGSYPPVSVEIDPNVIHYGEIRITGSYDHTPIHTERALRILSKNLINVEDLISRTFSLDELERGFETVKKGEALKVNIKP
ncbi:MAG: alcohol dehydrogenase catalytic domain-containing protein [Candidatus Bathyarchaeia archaeon]|nr:alcohol dehydrogenase catalytic domain-containing protein [Candidatus Bathyarchaeota archaeon]